MTIYSALYYPGSLAKRDLIVRDNRFYPGKYAETFPVWLAYVRKHYPRAHLILFADESSPVAIRPLLQAHLTEPWDEEDEMVPDSFDQHDVDGSGDPPLIHVHWINQFAGQYFRPMQRNLVAAMVRAYDHDTDMLWWDNDAFCNTNIAPLVHDIDFAAASIEHHQQTAASVFTYISARRLHALDDICSLPEYLTRMVNEGPVETRMHSLQEGGLYKLFCYGETKDLGMHLDLSHLSCFSNFRQFLRNNPLDHPSWYGLILDLDGFTDACEADGRLGGVDMKFHDMYFSTK